MTMRLAIIMALMGLPASAMAAPDGAALYKRCAACHLPTGAGVPGAFPALVKEPRKLATKPEGRRYLALVVTRGASGPMVVDGKSYRGIMPAQSGLDDEAVAAVLNHVTGTLGTEGKAPKPFTAAEIAAARKGGAALTSADVGKLHERVSVK
jgi:mono/diheme cytochrome c family protein